MSVADIKHKVGGTIEGILADYGLVIGCLVIGIIIGWYLKFFLADRRYIKQIEIRFKEKDDYLNDLRKMVYGRLNEIAVEKKDRNYFIRLKRFFKTNIKSKS